MKPTLLSIVLLLMGPVKGSKLGGLGPVFISQCMFGGVFVHFIPQRWIRAAVEEQLSGSEILGVHERGAASMVGMIDAGLPVEEERDERIFSAIGGPH